MAQRKLWTPKEVERLILRKKQGVKTCELTKLFDRTSRSIEVKLNELKVLGYFSKKEEE